jgi:hypothetical protein
VHSRREFAQVVLSRSDLLKPSLRRPAASQISWDVAGGSATLKL